MLKVALKLLVIVIIVFKCYLSTYFLMNGRCFICSKVNIIQMLKVALKLLVIVIIVFKCYLSTYCLMNGRCFICSNF